MTTATLKYGWTWLDAENDDGDWYILITDLSEPDADGVQYADGEEIATILCRRYETVKAEHPEWIEAKERHAKMIVDALNAQEQVRYLVAWTGGYEQPSYAVENHQQKAMERAAGWRADMDERDQVDIVAFDGNGNVRLVDSFTIDSEDDA